MKILFFTLLLIPFLSCGIHAPQKPVTLKVVNWNVQTFFDACNDGGEYTEFLKSKKWGPEAYKDRLKKLSSAINKLDGDIVILEEIENAKILYDISNALAGSSWNQKKVYRYACFSKSRNSSIGCAVISRRRLQNLKVHSLELYGSKFVLPAKERHMSTRPIIEVDLIAERDRGPLKIFVNHWKSKSGNKGNSREIRAWQEEILAAQIARISDTAPETPVICAGDFNQDIEEFCRQGQRIRLNAPAIKKAALVYSPWTDFPGGIGSYNFRDRWERIDHFFSAGSLVISGFSPRTGDWAYEDGRPKPFKLYSLAGWSDHLPIVCTVTF